MRAFFRYFAMQQEITVLTLFLLGFFGGTHCAGMCGGLSSAFALHLPPHIGRVWLILLMNLGRISSYTLIGALMGALSQAGMLLDHTRTLQLVLFAAANLLLLMMGLYLSGISAAAGKIETLGKPVWRRWGWLPCGLVYNASLYALGSGSALKGALYLAAFGLGTLPNLLAMGIFASCLQRVLQNRRIRLAAGLLVCAWALWQLALLWRNHFSA